MAATGCELAGPPGANSGEITISVRNTTTMQGVFEFLRIADGHTWDELKAHVDEERRLASADDTPLGPPAWVSEIGRVEVAADQSGMVLATANPGVHALVCGLIGSDGANPIGSVYVVGPFVLAD